MVSHRFVWGPVELNTNDPEFFQVKRFASWDAFPDTSDQPESWLREHSERRFEWSAHIRSLASYTRIELWMDPDPNAQLQLLYLLHYFSTQSSLITKVFIAQIKRPLGETPPHEHRILSPEIFQATESQFAIAVKAWNAFRQPTPQAWSALLVHDVSAIPGLRHTLLNLLAELPSTSNGLRASELKLLELVTEDYATPLQVISRMTHCVFGYWELGRLLNLLGRGPEPAITGIKDVPFDLALHEDAHSFNAYMSSTLNLSAFGLSLLLGEDNIMRKVSRKFWWGGTLITSERPWYWNIEEGILIY